MAVGGDSLYELAFGQMRNRHVRLLCKMLCMLYIYIYADVSLGDVGGLLVYSIGGAGRFRKSSNAIIKKKNNIVLELKNINFRMKSISLAKRRRSTGRRGVIRRHHFAVR